MDDRPRADSHIIIKSRVRVDANARANDDVSADDNVRSDPDAIAKLRRRVNRSHRVYERLEGWLWMKEPERARVGQISIRSAKNGNLSSDFDIRADVDAGRMGRLNARRIARVGQEGDLS